MNNSQKLAAALIKDFNNPAIKHAIDIQKVNEWKDPSNFWPKMLTNQIHLKSNYNVLQQRINTDGYRFAVVFNNLSNLKENELFELFSSFVPGGQFVAQKTKVNNLINAIRIIKKEGFESLFGSNKNKASIISTFNTMGGFGPKLARNIPMDLYHPAFRNGTIPVDANWIKIAEYLEKKWKDSNKHEQKIIEWKNEYIGSDLIKEDWEFDRLIYQSFNSADSNTRKLLGV